MDKDDKLPDIFPDLVYTLLLQLSSSQGPEAVSPVLKTWRLVYSGTLPEEMNLQRCSHGRGAWSARPWAWARCCLLKVTRLQELPPRRGPHRPLLVGEKFPEDDLTHDPPSNVSSTVWFSEFAEPPSRIVVP